MKKAEIVCPDCGKRICFVSEDSIVTLFAWCKRCRQEKIIPYNRAKEPPKK